jgi:hypothetical protein
MSFRDRVGRHVAPNIPNPKPRDLMLPAAEKITLILEGIGDDKIRVNSF